MICHNSKASHFTHVVLFPLHVPTVYVLCDINIFVIIRNISSWLHVSLAAIGKSRPVYYDRALSVLFGFDPNLETSKGAHSGSLKYSLKTAFLGFLRSPCQAMLEVSSPYLATSSSTIFLNFKYKNTYVGDAFYFVLSDCPCYSF